MVDGDPSLRVEFSKMVESQADAEYLHGGKTVRVGGEDGPGCSVRLFFVHAWFDRLIDRHRLWFSPGVSFFLCSEVRYVRVVQRYV